MFYYKMTRLRGLSLAQLYELERMLVRFIDLELAGYIRSSRKNLPRVRSVIAERVP